jgi:hypothetical protein
VAEAVAEAEPAVAEAVADEEAVVPAAAAVAEAVVPAASLPGVELVMSMGSPLPGPSKAWTCGGEGRGRQAGRRQGGQQADGARISTPACNRCQFVRLASCRLPLCAAAPHTCTAGSVMVNCTPAEKTARLP